MNMPQTELKLAFDLEDKYYSAGLKSLLEQVFTAGMGFSLRPIPVSSMQSALASVDIYVKHFAAGEVSICRPSFKLRKKNALLIVISEGINPPRVNDFSECLKGCVVLRKADSVLTIREKIIQAWSSKSEAENKIIRCANCRAVYLSEAEDIIAMYICHNFTVARIASILQISSKRVSAYKRSIMAKFNLHSEAELVLFINKWRASISFMHKVSCAPTPLTFGRNIKSVVSNGDRELIKQVSEQENKDFYFPSLI